MPAILKVVVASNIAFVILIFCVYLISASVVEKTPSWTTESHELRLIPIARKVVVAEPLPSRNVSAVPGDEAFRTVDLSPRPWVIEADGSVRMIRKA